MRAPRSIAKQTAPAPPRLLDAVPADVLAQAMLPFLRNENAAQWAQASRAARRIAAPALRNRQNALEEELEALGRVARLGVTRAKNAKNANKTGEAFKRALDALPRDRFAVARRQTSGWVGYGTEHALDADITSTHFSARVRFAQTVRRNVVMDSSVDMTVALTKTPAKKLVFAWDSDSRMTLQRLGGFPRRWADRF